MILSKLGRWLMIALGLGVIAATLAVDAVTDRIDKKKAEKK